MKPKRFRINKRILKKVWTRDYQLLLLCLPVIIYVFIFDYIPMYGVQLAFREFQPAKGLAGGTWVGLKYFERFFSSYQFWSLMKNTLGLSLYGLLAGFPLPIILALTLNRVGNLKFKKLIQTVTYAPHFISVVVMCGMISIMLSPRTGIINIILKMVGLEPVFFLARTDLFKSIIVWTDVWQGMGWGAIIYIAALSAVSPELYEAAKIDGANKFQLMWLIDFPMIFPTISIMFILRMGSIMNVGMQKVFLLQNPLNLGSSEIIGTYVYKIGMINAQYSYSTAIGLFNTIINIILLLTVNYLSGKFSETSLF